MLLDGCNANDSQNWDALVNNAPVPDVYYRPGYVSAYSCGGDSKPAAFVVRNGSTKALIPLLIRNLDVGGQRLQDAITPYGYGGLLRLGGPTHPGPRVAQQVFGELRDWARSSGIVACTIRLHPLFDQEDCWGLARVPEDWVRVFPRGQTTAVDLGRWDDSRRRLTGMYKGRRYDLKRGRTSLQVRITTGSSSGGDRGVFRALYRDAMQRLHASSFFLFPDDYYECFARELGGKFMVATASLGDDPVASAIFLADRDFMHYHLACSNDKGRAHGASTLLVLSAAEWGRQRGCTFLHLGGGLQPGDGLWLFKRSFGGPVFHYSYLTIVADLEKYKFLARQSETSWPYTSWGPSTLQTSTFRDQNLELRTQAPAGGTPPAASMSHMAGLSASFPSQPTECSALPLVEPETSIRDTMAVIDQYAKGIAIMVDENRRLLATVTDGDIRRAILAGTDLNQPVMQLKSESVAKPITATQGTPESEILALMQLHVVRQIPLLDEDGRVCDLAMIDDLIKEADLPVTGVIMAGGYGKRLLPLTESLPKPMLPVNGRPLLEHMLNKLQKAGIRSVNVTTHHLSERIVEHFNDGSQFGVRLNYLQEAEPLGTAGALAKMSSAKEPLLVLNGDILTDVDVRAMLHFHREHRADLTIGVRQYDIEVPFGVVETNGNAKVSAITEKPVLRHFINAGIYLVDPAMCRLVPNGRYFDMPDLIKAAINSGATVISFPIREYWLDIGQLEQYQKAAADVAEGIV